MKRVYLLLQEQEQSVKRWIIVLIGLVIQGIVLLLLIFNAAQSTYAEVLLAPVDTNARLCRIESIAPLSEANRLNVQVQTLVRILPVDASGIKNCEITSSSSSIRVETVGSGSPIYFTIRIYHTAHDIADIIVTSMLACIFGIAGIAIFIRAQDRAMARIAYGLFYTVSLIFCLFYIQNLHIPWVSTLLLSLILITNGLSTTFVSLFPGPRKKANSLIKSVISPYTPLIMSVILVLLALPVVLWEPDFIVGLLILITIYNIICLLIIIWALLWGMRKIARNERPLARTVMIGVAFLLIIITIVFNNAGPMTPGQHGLLTYDFFAQKSLLRLIFFPLVILPIITLFRNQLLGSTTLLSRQVMRILLWILLAGLFIATDVAMLRFLDSLIPRSVHDVQNYLYAGLLGLSLLLFPLVWNKVRDVGDHIFYHDFYQYNRALGELSAALTSLHGLDQISAFLLPRLAQLLNAPDVVLFIRALSQDEMNDSNEDREETARSWHLYRTVAPDRLAEEELVRVVDYALKHTGERSHEPSIVKGICVVALYNGDRVSGFLCLGAKRNLEAYSNQDKSFLATLAAQLSVLEANNRYLAQAQANAQKMMALTHRVISAQEAERRHLALDLHDDVLQEAMLLVRQLSDASTMSDVADVMPLARAVVTDLRRTCLALRPSLLDELGLTEALRWLARQTEQQVAGNIKVDFDYIGQTNIRFAMTSELAFYRVAQEALANVVKHAQATRAIVRLRSNAAGHLTLTIVDNGQGFRRRHILLESLGIVGMHERMDAIGGQIQLRTTPGKGTIVRATCRMNRDTKNMNGSSNEIPTSDSEKENRENTTKARERAEKNIYQIEYALQEGQIQ